ncbi:MAG: hypothetical protein ACRDXX_00640 [Stackebrandtia sp.]
MRRAPLFHALDPGLDEAERLLDVSNPDASGKLSQVLSALPDEVEAVRRLNAVLAQTGATLRLRSGVVSGEEGARQWRLELRGGTSDSCRLAAAAAGLAGLVAADGWRRVKRCAIRGCQRGFVDRTNAVSRRYCRAHSRHFED